MPNQNDDRPDQAMAGFLRDQILSFKEMLFESGKQQDSIATWLVGMSTGSIALIISQFGKFSPNLYPALKMSLFFFTGTIILGLLFRIFHRHLQEKDIHDLMFVAGWLFGYSQNSNEIPIELPEDSSAEFIAWYLYNQMGINMDPQLIEYLENNTNVEYWQNLYEEYAILRHRLAESKHQIVRQMVEDFYALTDSLEGRPPQKYDEYEQTVRTISESIRKRRLRKFCKFVYILMCISFAVSVLFISCSFIKTDFKVKTSSTTTNQKVTSPSKQVQPTQTDKPD